MSIVDALDIKNKIRIIEYPELYSEMLAEGRHFRDAVISLGMSPQALHHDDVAIEAIMRRECPNYLRRNGNWNDEAESLRAMLRAGLVALVDDYTQIASSAAPNLINAKFIIRRAPLVGPLERNPVQALYLLSG